MWIPQSIGCAVRGICRKQCGFALSAATNLPAFAEAILWEIAILHLAWSILSVSAEFVAADCTLEISDPFSVKPATPAEATPDVMAGASWRPCLRFKGITSCSNLCTDSHYLQQKRGVMACVLLASGLSLRVFTEIEHGSESTGPLQCCWTSRLCGIIGWKHDLVKFDVKGW